VATVSSFLLDDSFATGLGLWNTIFDGYGSVGVAGSDPAAALAPKASTQPGETHAALVASKAQFGDLDLTLRMQTVRQLRTGSAPNPWETAWALWNYTDNTHFTYLVLKPNGWELGKEDPAYPGAQRFLATGSDPFPVGSWYQVHVHQVANTISVSVDGKLLTTFVDNERPYTSGAVALYTEDADVRFDDVRVQAA
jgi:hypothetical protein